jgi:cob(I)alamin adenosyltransferase
MKMTVILFTVCVLALSGCSPKPKTTDTGRELTSDAPQLEQPLTAAENDLASPGPNSYQDTKTELTGSPIIELDEEEDEKAEADIDIYHPVLEKLPKESFAKESNQTEAAAHLTASRSTARSAAGRLNALFEESEREPEAVPGN